MVLAALAVGAALGACASATDSCKQLPSHEGLEPSDLMERHGCSGLCRQNPCMPDSSKQLHNLVSFEAPGLWDAAAAQGFGGKCPVLTPVAPECCHSSSAFWARLCMYSMRRMFLVLIVLCLSNSSRAYACNADESNQHINQNIHTCSLPLAHT